MNQVLIGMAFKPTFQSNIDHYEVRGYDEDKKMVLTKVYSKDGNVFDDGIEEEYYQAAFENGDYVEIDNAPFVPEISLPIHNYYNIPSFDTREPMFNDAQCMRCVNRFGYNTRQREWCENHHHCTKCYRFKLDK